MTATGNLAWRKLSLLDLAKDLDNVSRACRLMGYSRQRFYEIRCNFQTFGADGPIDRLPGTRGSHPNGVSTEIEAVILDHALEHPCHGSSLKEEPPKSVGQVHVGDNATRVRFKVPLTEQELRLMGK